MWNLGFGARNRTNQESSKAPGAFSVFGLVGRSFPTYAVVKRRRLQRSWAGRVVKPVIDMAVLGQVQSSTASMSDVWKLAATGELFAGVKLGFQPLPSNNF